MSSNLPVDVIARELPDRVACYVAGLGYEGEADKIVRDLAMVLESYELRLRMAERHVRETGSAFVGKLIRAKFPSRCAVCAQGVSEGSDVVYNPDAKKVAHVGCAEVRP